MSNLAEIFVKNTLTLLGTRTPYWLSKESKLAQATISRILAGKMAPSLESIQAVATALGVTASSMISEGAPIAVEIRKEIVHRLDEGSRAAVHAAIAEAFDPLAVEATRRIPRDILEAMVSQDHDWNFVRAQFDLPERSQEKRKGKSS